MNWNFFLLYFCTSQGLSFYIHFHTWLYASMIKLLNSLWIRKMAPLKFIYGSDPFIWTRKHIGRYGTKFPTLTSKSIQGTRLENSLVGKDNPNKLCSSSGIWTPDILSGRQRWKLLHRAALHLRQNVCYILKWFFCCCFKCTDHNRYVKGKMI